MTSNKFALAFAGALALAGCKNDNKENQVQLSPEEIAAQMQERLDSYKISLQVPVTRNGESFNISVDAFCNAVDTDDHYAQNCAQEATKAIQTKMACHRFALAAGATRSNNPDIVAIGLPGQYDARYLHTEERLINAIQSNDKLAFKENFYVITDIDDMDAARRTYQRDDEKPEFCPQ